jgi:uncharacterized membrane protein
MFLNTLLLFIFFDIIYFYYISYLPFNHNITIEKTYVKLLSALLCYLLMTFSLNYFVLSKSKSIKDAFILGFIIYGIYNTTNYTILKDWNIYMSIIDTFWGGILFSLTTYILTN